MAYPDEDNLTTRETVKDWLGIDGTTSDGVLNALINRVSNLLSHLTNKPYLLSRTYRDTFNGNGKDITKLNVIPITAVSSVTINGNSIPAITSIGSSGYSFDNENLLLRGYTFDFGINNVVVEYTAGYGVSDREWKILEQACLEAINFKWERKEHPDRIAEDMGNQITAKFSEEDLPKEVICAVQRLARLYPTKGKTEIVI